MPLIEPYEDWWVESDTIEKLSDIVIDEEELEPEKYNYNERDFLK